MMDLSKTLKTALLLTLISFSAHADFRKTCFDKQQECTEKDMARDQGHRWKFDPKKCKCKMVFDQE